MKYNLNQTADQPVKKISTIATLKKIFAFMAGEHKILFIALGAMLINAALSLLAPVMIGHTIDTYVVTKQYHGVLIFSGILLVMYILNMGAGYF